MNKIKKKLQIYFKSLFQIIFKLLYGKIIYKENCFTSSKVERKIIENITPNNEILKKYHSYKIIDGRIYTDYVENVAIIDKNTIINDISFQQVSGELKNSSHNVVLKKGTPRIKKKFNGNILSLVQGASGNENYFHWMFDILPKIKLCSEHYPIDEINFFYLPKLQKFQKETLSVFNIGENRIINSKIYRHIEGDNIISVDHPWYREGFILDKAKYMPSWIIFWLRNTYLKYAEKFDANKKIFIDRTESKFNHCQIQNNEEVSNYLENNGFTKYQVGQLSFFKQIYLFNNAKIIVGAHGAAFANLMFCKPNTNIIEIKPATHPNTVDERLSEINKLNFKLIETEKLSEENKKYGDIYLDTKILEKYIKNYN